MPYFILKASILISSLSFLGYAISYFTSSHMKREFERFNLKKFGLIVILFEGLGAIGLLVGMYFKPILLVSSGGLALLMFLGVVTRLRVKDSLRVTLPALFFMFLNAVIFLLALEEV